ncbi:hypothetical protein OsI_37812 [Oryza sativa Indica Group]|uniref:3-deoxy-8-phosphooctulonate synthase n=1 Tax=Oryza sativa subsp. indica TaxID=39946 RepID=B8BNM6_ORYSI|nr:hypothetical protein OsI_37812 [Oryza sativa Indica Group]
MKAKFLNLSLPVDSIAIHDPFVDTNNNLEMSLEVYPSGKDQFSEQDISGIGFILSNQTYKPPSNFGPYYFLGQTYSFANGRSKCDDADEHNAMSIWEQQRSSATGCEGEGSYITADTQGVQLGASGSARAASDVLLQCNVVGEAQSRFTSRAFQPIVYVTCVGLGAAAAADAMDASSVALYGQLKAAQPFFLLAGPNVIESEEHVLKMAKHIKGITTKLGLPLVFKSSFDKANRTSSKSFRGPGLEEGLKILEKVKTTYDLPVVTDVHESHQCEAVGRVADIIQIPAFLCRQTDLLVAAAKTGKIINIKKGQFCAPSVMANSAEKIRLAGNQNVMVCERGTMFGYNDLIVDPRNFEWLREANCPVVADVTHALQQPAGKKLDGGGVASGGLRELIPCIARTSVAVGIDGIFMEVHDDPLNAPCDGPTQWPLRNLEELLEELIAIARVTKGKKPLKIDLTPFKE